MHGIMPLRRHQRALLLLLRPPCPAIGLVRALIGYCLRAIILLPTDEPQHTMLDARDDAASGPSRYYEAGCLIQRCAAACTSLRQGVDGLSCPFCKGRASLCFAGIVKRVAGLLVVGLVLAVVLFYVGLRFTFPEQF